MLFSAVGGVPGFQKMSESIPIVNMSSTIRTRAPTKCMATAKRLHASKYARLMIQRVNHRLTGADAELLRRGGVVGVGRILGMKKPAVTHTSAITDIINSKTVLGVVFA